MPLSGKVLPFEGILSYAWIMLTKLKIKEMHNTENNNQKDEGKKKEHTKIRVHYYYFKEPVFVKHKHVKSWISFDQPN